MERDASVRQPEPLPQARTPGARRRVLAVEPDPLTQWSLKTYLSKWFDVYATSSPDDARHTLETHPVDVLIVSDQLAAGVIATLEQHAHTFNTCVDIVRTVADAAQASTCCDTPRCTCIEKPFELAQLARLLGIPESQLPAV